MIQPASKPSKKNLATKNTIDPAVLLSDPYLRIAFVSSKPVEATTVASSDLAILTLVDEKPYIPAAL